MEGPSDFTRCEPLLLMSSPCNRPRGSFCKISEIGCEYIGCRYWVDMLEWEWWNGGNCMFGWPAGPNCWGSERKDDEVYGMCCIPRSNESEGLIISPVAIFSLSTSCFNAAFRAARYQVLLAQDNKLAFVTRETRAFISRTWFRTAWKGRQLH